MKDSELLNENSIKVAKVALEDIRRYIRVNQEELSELYERIEMLEYVIKELQCEELALMMEFWVV